MVEFYKTDLV